MKIVYSFLFFVAIFALTLADDTTTTTTTAPPNTEKAGDTPAAKPKGGQPPNPMGVFQQMALVAEKSTKNAVDTGSKITNAMLNINPQQEAAAPDSWFTFWG